jgi:hypothetical protein
MRAGLPFWEGFQSPVPYAGEHGDARPSLTYVDPSGFNLGRVRKLDDARAACTRSPSWLGVGHQRTEPKVVAALRGEDWLHGGPAAGLGLIGDLQLAVSGPDACGFRRCAGCMRYAQGGGLTPEGRRRLEQVRLEAVKRSGTA